MSEEAEDTLLPNSKENISLTWSLMAFRVERAHV